MPCALCSVCRSVATSFSCSSNFDEDARPVLASAAAAAAAAAQAGRARWVYQSELTLLAWTLNVTFGLISLFIFLCKWRALLGSEAFCV